MIGEDILLNYGVAGAMLIYFIYDKIKFQKSIWKVINNNTIALTKIYEVISKCKKK
ncbi:MAG: hypothetical protein WC346_12440 [Methanogenium sp.]|jgi:hypothetical protein